ncbi:MAG: ATP phosphoribosyltransferase regulatory subunit, partial [Pseudomonadota bacterium]
TGAGVGEYAIRVNTRLLLDGVMHTAEVRDPDTRLIVLRALDKLDRLGAEGVAALLSDGREDESGDFTKGAGLSASSIDRFLAFAQSARETRSDTLNALSNVAGDSEAGAAGVEELGAIHAVLNGLGVDDQSAVFDPAIVRGLEYYTGPVFEAELYREFKDEKGRLVRFGSVGGGGRYDDLVARFRGELVPATGFSVGISRLAAVTAAENEAASDGPVVVLALDREYMADYCAMAAELRNAGVRTETYLGSSGMRAQMKYADRRRAPAVIIVGEDERASGKVTIKDLKAGAEAAKSIEDNAEWRASRPGQFDAPRSEMTARIKAIVEAG